MNELTVSLKDDKNLIRLIADALSSDTRLKILEEIKNHSESHKVLAERVGITTSTITFHLNSLIASGIVNEDERIGGLGKRNKKPRLKINKIVIEL